MVIDGHKCYQLQFKPKRKQELTFTGNMWAADTTFGIIQIEMSIADELSKLVKLKETGVINDEEFNTLKSKLLGV